MGIAWNANVFIETTHMSLLMYDTVSGSSYPRTFTLKPQTQCSVHKYDDDDKQKSVLYFTSFVCHWKQTKQN